MNGEMFAERLVELGEWLEPQRALWVSRPFTGLPVAWEADEPEMAGALRALSAETLEAYEARPWDLPDMPQPWRERVAVARTLTRVPSLEAPPLARKRPRGVPGRKWRQIAAFASAVFEARRADSWRVTRWLDWCSGKGHLGRTLAEASGLPLVCVERDAALCRAGGQIADDVGIAGRFVPVDVLEARLAETLQTGAGLQDREDLAVVALHACGRLHRELLAQVTANPVSVLALAPCCYHRFHDVLPHPMSIVGRRVDLRLEPNHLRLIGLNEVVARPRRQALRRREQAFRLGLDLLLREVTGEDRYRALGSVPSEWVELSFEGFCRQLARAKGLELPERARVPIRFDEYETRGQERHHFARALGMMRGLFQRPLEMWVLFDLCQFLIEQEWSVRLVTFCGPEVTPRNCLILASR